jgi:hypothetical protein
MNEKNEILERKISNLIKRRASKRIGSIPIVSSLSGIFFGLLMLAFGSFASLGRSFASLGRFILSIGAVLLIPGIVVYIIFYMRYQSLRNSAFSSKETKKETEVYLMNYLQRRDYKDQSDKGEAAIKILSEEKCGDLVNFLIRFYQEGKHKSTMRSEIIDAVEKIADIKAVAMLIEALKDEDANIRSKVARILGDMNAERAVDPLTQLLNDKEKIVRTSAAEALNKIKK